MAIAFVKEVATGSNKVAVASFSLTIPAAGVALGNRIILMMSRSTTTGTDAVTISDSKGLTWRSDSVGGSQNLGSGEVRIYSADVTTALVSGDTVTVTMTGSNGGYVASLSEWSGIIRGSNPADYTAGGAADFDSSANNRPPTTVFVTGAGEGRLLFCGLFTNGPIGDAFTQDSDTVDAAWQSNLTRIGTTGGGATTNYTLAAAQKFVTTTATQTYNPTVTNRNWSTRGLYYLPPVRGRGVTTIGQAVNRGAVWMKRRSGIVVPRLWIPQAIPQAV